MKNEKESIRFILSNRQILKSFANLNNIKIKWYHTNNIITKKIMNGRKIEKNKNEFILGVVPIIETEIKFNFDEKK